MLPIGDENPIKIQPIVNWSIIILCILVFLWQNSGGYSFFIYTLETFGVTPAFVPDISYSYTLVTNMFLHTSWEHLLGNLMFLWIFGDNVEDCCGHLKYLGFYLACGIIASLIWSFTEWGGLIPAVGASGAISGVLGAYYILFPDARVKTIIGLGFFFRVTRVKASTMIGVWFGYQLLLAFISGFSNVAYWAHVGGFVAGLVLAYILKPKLRRKDPYVDYYENNYRNLDDWR